MTTPNADNPYVTSAARATQDALIAATATAYTNAATATAARVAAAAAYSATPNVTTKAALDAATFAERLAGSAVMTAQQAAAAGAADLVARATDQAAAASAIAGFEATRPAGMYSGTQQHAVVQAISLLAPIIGAIKTNADAHAVVDAQVLPLKQALGLVPPGGSLAPTPADRFDGALRELMDLGLAALVQLNAPLVYGPKTFSLGGVVRGIGTSTGNPSAGAVATAATIIASL